MAPLRLKVQDSFNMAVVTSGGRCPNTAFSFCGILWWVLQRPALCTFWPPSWEPLLLFSRWAHCSSRGSAVHPLLGCEHVDNPAWHPSVGVTETWSLACHHWVTASLPGNQFFCHSSRVAELLPQWVPKLGWRGWMWVKSESYHPPNSRRHQVLLMGSQVVQGGGSS